MSQGLEEAVLGLISRKDCLPLGVPELAKKLGTPPAQKKELQDLLRRLVKEGKAVRLEGNRYAPPPDDDLVAGKIRINRSGNGYFQPDAPGEAEIAIPGHATATALHEDKVLVRRVASRRSAKSADGQGDSGAVVSVTKRKRTQIVGSLRAEADFLYVTPDDPRIPHDIRVPAAKDVGRQPNIGDKVVVELMEWETRNDNPEGKIIEVLGPPDAEGVDMLSVLRQYSLPLRFPDKVLEEAEAITSGQGWKTPDGQIAPLEKDCARRVDCRGDDVITIDPDDAKDFDDAIFLRRAGKGQYHLWVHIADVSHYVRVGTALDAEAQKRGNSTYLVDRVIPMLPEALSNELCSLKPNVDRLTKCVEFLITAEGQVLDAKFHSAVIHSKRRFSYREALAVLQGEAKDPIERMLQEANDLAQQIRRARFKAGSLDLDFPERKIRLDEKGQITRIELVENDISHQLIEEFMLLANEAVATRLISLNLPAIHRVHEAPEEKRLNEYREEVLSHNLPCGNLSHRPEVQKLLEKLNTLLIGPALKIGFLKSLMRARYAVEPLGHYGLNKEKYTHFTSPIRRYSDLVVHRVLFAPNKADSFASLKAVADHISDTERNSADAERDSKDLKLFAYLRKQLASDEPQRYAALVTEARNFGFFVDVPDLGMSGLVPLSSLADDRYYFDFGRNHLVGRRTRRIIKLGDKVEVQVARVDMAKKQVDFRLAPSVGQEKPARREASPRRQPQAQRPPSAQQPAPAQRKRGPDRPPAAQRPPSAPRPSHDRPAPANPQRHASERRQPAPIQTSQAKLPPLKPKTPGELLQSPSVTPSRPLRDSRKSSGGGGRPPDRKPQGRNGQNSNSRRPGKPQASGRPQGGGGGGGGRPQPGKGSSQNRRRQGPGRNRSRGNPGKPASAS